jgi:hypothetical protein
MSGAYSGQRTEIFAASRRKGRGVGKTRWPSGIHRANVSLDAPLRVEARFWHISEVMLDLFQVRFRLKQTPQTPEPESHLKT